MSKSELFQAIGDINAVTERAQVRGALRKRLKSTIINSAIGKKIVDLVYSAKQAIYRNITITPPMKIKAVAIANQEEAAHNNKQNLKLNKIKAILRRRGVELFRAQSSVNKKKKIVKLNSKNLKLWKFLVYVNLKKN